MLHVSPRLHICCVYMVFVSHAASFPCFYLQLPTRDKDRGKDYNHSTWIDLIIEVALPASFRAPAVDGVARTHRGWLGCVPRCQTC